MPDAKHAPGVHVDRMARFRAAGVYLVTSEALSAGRTTPRIVDAALAAGVRLIQLREKDLPLRELLPLAHTVRAQTREVGALLILNDRLDAALAVDADGVHLGQDDFPIAEARRLAPELILGASTHDVAEAEAAQEAGASYVNIGPIYPTQTKAWDDAFLGVEGLKRIAPHVRIPFTVMGGIKGHHVPALVQAGARTIAVVTEVTAAPDPRAAASDLLSGLRRAVAAVES